MRQLKLLVVGVIAVCSLSLMQTPRADAESQDAATTAPSEKCVLITGANRGLGLEFAKQYSDAGWTVIGTARKPAEAKELRATGATIMKLDVTSDADVAQLATDLKGRSIDLLINNAGIGGNMPTLKELDIDRAALVLDVNLIGPMRVTNALLPNLRAGEGKTIVSISSGLGSIERNTGGRFHGYRESKAGLNMFMRSIANELRSEGFTCIAMSPGWVRTDMGGENATLSPEESITGMRAVIDGLTIEQSGQFLSYTGEELPW
ncbi:MAG: SDR family oxidoreductase [Planctomycetota bacterium]